MEGERVIEFNGETFTGEKAWAAAYPAYGRHYWPLVKAGARTTMELEQAIYAKAQKARKASLLGTKRSPMNNSIKRKVGA